METLIYTDQKTFSRRSVIRQMIISIFLGITTVLTAANSFGIYFSLSGWVLKEEGGFAGSMARCWNQIAYKLLMEEGIVIKEADGAGTSCQFFLLTMMVLFSLLSWLILQSRNVWLLMIPFFCAFASTICFSFEPGIAYTAMMLLGIILMYLEIISDGRTGFWPASYTALVLLVTVALAGTAVTGTLFEKHVMAEKADSAIEEIAETLYYGENLLKNGKVTSEDRIKEDKETALVVTMNHPESMYLRGYVGEVYRDGQWSSLQNGIYDDTKDLFYWLKKEKFSGIGQIGQVNQLLNEKKAENDCSVVVENGDTRYAYIPYETTSVEGKGMIWYESFFKSNPLQRTKSYQFTASENAVKKWTDLSGQYYTSESFEELQAYEIAESYYNGFVYDHYTYISEAEESLFDKVLGGSGNQSQGHIEYKTAIQLIQKTLEEQILYTDYPAFETDSEEGVLDAFFEENKGYDVHYATAATLMFRYFGIPARYVEGYLITPEDVEDVSSGGEIHVPMDRMHAWTEIYVDGIGFVPIEVSPPYKGMMEEADLSIGLQNESVKKDFDRTNQDKDRTEYPERSKDGEKVNPILLQILWILFLLLLLIIVMVLAYKGAKMVSKYVKQKNLFERAPCKEAICAIYQHMTDLELVIHEEARQLGNKAAYSLNPCSEEERQKMLGYLTELKKEKRKHEK